MDGDSVKIEWSRNKFNASTPFLKTQGNEITFDYVFEINTITAVLQSTNLPNLSKMAKLRIISEVDNEILAYADFNMNDYGIDDVKKHILTLKKLDGKAGEQETENHIEVGLQGIYSKEIPVQRSLTVHSTLDTVHEFEYQSPNHSRGNSNKSSP